MQARGATLPELDAVGNDAEPAPALGPRHGRLVGEPLLRIHHLLLEVGARGDRLRLIARPRGHLRAARAVGEVGLRVLRLDPVGSAEDLHLPVQRVPRKHCGHTGVRLQGTALARGVVGVERETPLVDTAQQHRADRRGAVGVDRAEHHRVRLVHPSLGRLGQPGGELGDRVCREVTLLELLDAVIGVGAQGRLQKGVERRLGWQARLGHGATVLRGARESADIVAAQTAITAARITAVPSN